MSNLDDIIIDHLLIGIELYIDSSQRSRGDELEELSKYFYAHCFCKENYMYTLSDIDDLADRLLSKKKYSKIDVVNYLDFICNEDLYRIGLELLEKREKVDFLFYNILWIEHLKYSLYDEISISLVDYDQKSKIINQSIHIQCLQHKRQCLDLIDKYYKKLLIEFGYLYKEIEYCEQLIDYYKIYNINIDYEIEIIIEK